MTKKYNSSLTDKQKAFCEHFARTGNIEQSVKEAGYKTKTPDSFGNKLLKNDRVTAHLKILTERVKSEKESIGIIEEVIEFYLRVLRGEERETIYLASSGMVFKRSKPPSINEKLKAAQELIKRFPLLDPANVQLKEINQRKIVQMEANTEKIHAERKYIKARTSALEEIGGADMSLMESILDVYEKAKAKGMETDIEEAEEETETEE